MDHELLHFLFDFESVVFVVELVEGVEEAVVDHDAELGLVVDFLDFLDEDEEGGFGADDEVLSFVLNFEVGVGLAGEEAGGSGEADLVLEIHEVLGDELLVGVLGEVGGQVGPELSRCDEGFHSLVPYIVVGDFCELLCFLNGFERFLKLVPYLEKLAFIFHLKIHDIYILYHLILCHLILGHLHLHSLSCHTK